MMASTVKNGIDRLRNGNRRLRSAITLKLKMSLFLDEACSCAERTDIYLLPLMPDEDNNFGGSLFWILKIDDFSCNPRISALPTWIQSAPLFSPGGWGR